MRDVLAGHLCVQTNRRGALQLGHFLVNGKLLCGQIPDGNGTAFPCLLKLLQLRSGPVALHISTLIFYPVSKKKAATVVFSAIAGTMLIGTVEVIMCRDKIHEKSP